MIKNEVIKINGMTCRHCVKAVESELGKLDLANFSVDIGSASIEYDDSKLAINEIIEAVKESGYEVANSFN